MQDLALFDLSGASGAYTGVIDLMERHVSRAWQPLTEIIDTVETMSTSQSGESETVIVIFTGAITDDRTKSQTQGLLKRTRRKSTTHQYEPAVSCFGRFASP